MKRGHAAAERPLQEAGALPTGDTPPSAIPSPLLPLRSLIEHIRNQEGLTDVDGYKGGTSSQCMCNKESSEMAVTNCRKKGEEGEQRSKRSVRATQKSLQLLVMARCDLRDKPICVRREKEKKRKGG